MEMDKVITIRLRILVKSSEEIIVDEVFYSKHLNDRQVISVASTFYFKLYKHKKLNVIDFVDRLVTRNRYYTCLPLYHQNLIRFEGKIVDYVYTIILKQGDIGRHFY